MERYLAMPIIDNRSGEILYDVVTALDEIRLKKIIEAGVESFTIADDLAEGADDSIIRSFIADHESLRLLKQTEEIEDENQLAAIRIYKVMRPGEPVTAERKKLFKTAIF